MFKGKWGIGALLLAGAVWLGWSKIPAVTTPEPVVAAVGAEIPSDCPDNPVELGTVCWLRHLDTALLRAEATRKPVFILFQEVPGCSNCTRYGSATLSHPLITEAIESLFVPLCIYNNKKGSDAAALDRFGEPSWNNPVVRITDAAGADLAGRMPDFRSQSELLQGMCLALGQKAPQWLQLLREEVGAREHGTDTATFSMYCFWSGEATFGALDGVIETSAGYQDGKEVVKVVFDPSRTSKTTLESQTMPQGIRQCSRNEGFREDKEPKYYLSNSLWKHVPMTALQACRVNSSLARHQSPENHLSPGQIALYEQVQRDPRRRKESFIGQSDLKKAWKRALAP